eukprot:2150239-Pyramimonas_sp.AAC.1
MSMRRTWTMMGMRKMPRRTMAMRIGMVRAIMMRRMGAVGNEHKRQGLTARPPTRGSDNDDDDRKLRTRSRWRGGRARGDGRGKTGEKDDHEEDENKDEHEEGGGDEEEDGGAEH